MTNTRSQERDYRYIRPLRDEHMKTWAKFDTSGRILVLYEAVVHAEDGAECLATVYYYDTATAAPTGSMERTAIWDGDWDTSLDAILVNGDTGYVP